MRKLLILLILMTLGLGVKAQCPLNTAEDFTATDVHGESIHLFDILDGGQYVLIDFFFTTCGGCIQTAPYFVESYALLGCNQHEVFYVEIDEGDNETACLNWVNRFGVEYPTISGNSGGTDICIQYGIQSFPTTILIAPDRSIVINDLWPINNAQFIISRLEAFGIEQHECTTDISETSAPLLSVFPNPANENVTLKGEYIGSVSVFNVLGQKIEEHIMRDNELNINTANYENGIYFIKSDEQVFRFVITH